MNPQNLKQAIGVFPNQQRLKQAMLELQSINFPMHQISIVTQNSNGTGNAIDNADQLPITGVEGAKAGALAGSVGVGLTTLTIGLGSLVVPGMGPALALDGILSALLGSGIASAIGGLYGAFLGWADPKKQLKLYGDQLNQDACLVILGVTENQILAVEPILRRCRVQSWQVDDLPKTLNSCS